MAASPSRSLNGLLRLSALYRLTSRPERKASTLSGRRWRRIRSAQSSFAQSRAFVLPTNFGATELPIAEPEILPTSSIVSSRSRLGFPRKRNYFSIISIFLPFFLSSFFIIPLFRQISRILPYFAVFFALVYYYFFCVGYRFFSFGVFYRFTVGLFVLANCFFLNLSRSDLVSMHFCRF